MVIKIRRLIIAQLRRGFIVQENEISALLWAFLYFFCLLSAYYILRPFRDEMGIAGGTENLPWLFTGTFLAMLIVVPVFGYITKRYVRKKFLPGIYVFFVINILGFFSLFKAGISPSTLAPIFFIWISVFNLFVVSVFWSFMTDIFSNTQSKRLFGIIAAGGSAGAIVGPAITTILAKPLGPVNLLLISAGLLLLALWCIKKLIVWSANKNPLDPAKGTFNSQEIPIGGGILAGIRAVFSSKYLMGISLLVVLYPAVSTFLYFEQAHLVEQAFDDPSSRTTLFAGIDLVTNILAISTQLFLTSRFINRFGMAITMAFIPLIVMLGFFSLSLVTILPILIIVQVTHRAGNYSLLKPCREILFTVANREDRYKAKNFIDTTVYRGSDAVTGWVFAGLLSAGFSLSAIALIAVPVAGMWMITGYTLGKKQAALKDKLKPKFQLTLSSQS